jgi:hypothetical protein
MHDFATLKNTISKLGRAEYRYDRLVCEFADHYIALAEAGYEHLPDLQVLREWQSQLNSVIRPGLLDAWRSMAAHFGFSLGDRIKGNDVDLYVVRMSCYPLENIVRFTGFGVKKNGERSSSSVDVTATEQSELKRTGHCLSQDEVDSLFFEGTTRSQRIREFLSLHKPDA